MKVRALTWAVVVAGLAGAFAAWRDPALVVALLNQVWACF